MTQANFGDLGYVGYRVAANVTSHEAYGVGVYTYFRDYNVTVASGISCPTDLISSFTAPLAVFLNGKGIMDNIIDNVGGKTWWGGQHVQYVC